MFHGVDAPTLLTITTVKAAANSKSTEIQGALGVFWVVVLVSGVADASFTAASTVSFTWHATPGPPIAPALSSRIRSRLKARSFEGCQQTGCKCWQMM